MMMMMMGDRSDVESKDVVHPSHARFPQTILLLSLSLSLVYF